MGKGSIGLMAALAFVAGAAAAVACRSDARTYEAEDAVLSGTVIASDFAGFTGMLAKGPPFYLLTLPT